MTDRVFEKIAAIRNSINEVLFSDHFKALLRIIIKVRNNLNENKQRDEAGRIQKQLNKAIDNLFFTFDRDLI